MELGKFLGENSVDEEFEFLEIEEEEIVGLSHWEFIDASDADSEENLHHHDNHHSDSEEQPEEEKDKDEESNGSDGLSIGSASVSPSISPIPSPVADPIGPHTYHRPQLAPYRDVGRNVKSHHDYDDGGDEDEGHDEDDDGYGLDDELVPWSVSDKFGRQRMRKLGKRTSPKMNNSKRSPYLLSRPGCVRGKHGLGLKHIY